MSKLKRLLSKVRLGHYVAFAAGSITTHEIGWSRHATVPEGLTIALYVLSGVVLLLALWTFWTFRHFERDMRRAVDEREKVGPS